MSSVSRDGNPALASEIAGVPVEWRRSGEGLPLASALRFAAPELVRTAAERHEPLAALREIQERRLRTIVEHAARTVPHYRRLFRDLGLAPDSIRSLEDLRKLPILERNEIGARTDDFLARPSAPAAPRTLRWFRTSGSTGSPLTVVFDDREYCTNLALILGSFMGLGWRPWHKLAYICVPTYPRRSRVLERFGLCRELVVDLREGPGANLRELEREAPEVIYGYPSHLALIARRIREAGGTSLRPRVVVTNGEILTGVHRRSISEAFGTAVRDTYGSAEFQRIATECERGRLHLATSQVVVEMDPETVDDDGAADAIITSLYQYAMPLLRLRIGDRIAMASEPCPCGSRRPGIHLVVGRCDDVIVLPSGREVSARAINHLEQLPGIVEYQIVQTHHERLLVRLHAAARLPPDTEIQARELIGRGLRGERVRIDVEYVDRIPRQHNHKLRTFISEIADH